MWELSHLFYVSKSQVSGLQLLIGERQVSQGVCSVLTKLWKDGRAGHLFSRLVLLQ